MGGVADGVSVPVPAAPRPGWRDTLRVYLAPESLRMLTLGFSAGLPLLLVLGTLSFRLREAGIDRSTIGYLSWVGLPYHDAATVCGCPTGTIRSRVARARLRLADCLEPGGAASERAQDVERLRKR